MGFSKGWGWIQKRGERFFPPSGSPVNIFEKVSEKKGKEKSTHL